VWIQNLTLEIDAVASQKTRDLSQETHDQTSQMLLAGYSQAELSQAELN